MRLLDPLSDSLWLTKAIALWSWPRLAEKKPRQFSSEPSLCRVSRLPLIHTEDSEPEGTYKPVWRLLTWKGQLKMEDWKKIDKRQLKLELCPNIGQELTVRSWYNSKESVDSRVSTLDKSTRPCYTFISPQTRVLGLSWWFRFPSRGISVFFWSHLQQLC